MRPPSCLEESLCRNGGSVDTLTGVEHLAEPDGFRDFVEARSSALLRSGWLLTGDWPSAEDLVQTALAAACPPGSGPWSCSAISPTRPNRRPPTRWAARWAR